MLDPDSTAKIADQLLSGGTALAGLILVFLGSTLTAYDSYAADQQRSVRARYRTRALLAFLGFVGSLVAAVAGMSTHVFASPCAVVVGAVFLGIALLLTLACAALMLSDVW